MSEPLDLPSLSPDGPFLSAKISIPSHPTIIEISVEKRRFTDELRLFYESLTLDDFPTVQQFDEWAKQEFLDCSVDPAAFGLTKDAANEITNHYEITSIWLETIFEFQR